MFDLRCPSCDWRGEKFVPRRDTLPPCPQCGMWTTKDLVSNMPAIRTDEKFIGGMTIRNLGVRPVTVYSEQERQAIMKARGLRDVTNHTPIPGTDKSPHTSRWDGLLSPVSEDDRLKRWHEHEQELTRGTIGSLERALNVAYLNQPC